MQIAEKLHFCHWVLISLLLHASLTVPLCLANLHVSDQSRQEKLQMEIVGMIADRQTEERHKGEQEPQPAKPEARPVSNFVPRLQEKYLTTAAESPVQVRKVETMVSSFAPVVFATAGAAEAQKQQTIKAAIGAYMNKVGKRIRANLTYPKEVVENIGIHVTTVIAFSLTASGEIREGSLRIVRSSGYAVLDASALKAARVSAPFENPPKETDVVYSASFDR